MAQAPCIATKSKAESLKPTICLWLGRLIRFGLGALLLWASVPKIVHPTEFLASIYNYELVSPAIAMVAAAVLPWVEFVVGVCLLSGTCLPGALTVCAATFAVFAFAHASVLYRGMSIDCGCGLVPGDDHVTYFTLARSLFLMLSAGVAYWCVRVRERNPQAAPAMPVQLAEATSVAGSS